MYDINTTDYGYNTQCKINFVENNTQQLNRLYEIWMNVNEILNKEKSFTITRSGENITSTIDNNKALNTT